MSEHKTSARLRWFPWKMTGLSLLVAALVILARIFQFEMVDWTGLGADFLNAISTLAVVLLFFLWVGWCAFFSPFRWVGRWALAATVMLVPTVFFVFFQPQFGGSMTVRRLHYRFGKEPAPDITRNNIAAGNNGRDSEAGTEPGGRMLDETAPYSFAGFLGSDRNAVVDGLELEPDWDAHPPRRLWKIGVGAGWSGVAIANSFLVTMEQIDDREMVTCYELKTGAPVWEHTVRRRHEDTPGLGRQGPRSTPTISGGMVYAQGATGNLMALDGNTGQPVWETDLCELLQIGQNRRTNSAGLEYTFEKSRLAWGRAASPLVFDNKVIIPGGYGDDHREAGATLLAFDRESGELLWKTGNEMIAYGSPTLATVAGRRQILLQAEDQAMGFDAETGAVLWKYGREGGSNSDANCSQVTVVDQEHLLLTKGYNLGGELIRITGTGEVLSATQVWKNPRVLRTKLTNPVVRNGVVWAISDGFIECCDVMTGEKIWKQRGSYGDGQLLLVGKWLVIQSETGELQLVEATREEPGKSSPIRSVAGVCWNTLAISNDLLVVRSDREMACFRLATPGETVAGPGPSPAETPDPN